MAKLALILGIIGLGLLLVSLVPAPADAGPNAEATALTPEEKQVTDDVAQGRSLFLAKGCVTCHKHDALGDLAEKTSVGPDLSRYLPDPDFVRRWLRDPAAVRPDTGMPNLNLSNDEIGSLIAFLSAASAGEEPSDLAAAPESCPVTQAPEKPFYPPDPDPAQGEGLPQRASSLGSFEAYFWYGSEALWTQLRRDGVWRELPHTPRGYTQKIFFSRAGYDWREEPLPGLTISGRRLDAAGPTFEELEATNGYHPDIGSFMLIGVDIPAAGCWEMTGHYQGQDLSFVVWVAP